MSPLDDAVLAERASMVRRHLDRVAFSLPWSRYLSLTTPEVGRWLTAWGRSAHTPTVGAPKPTKSARFEVVTTTYQAFRLVEKELFVMKFATVVWSLSLVFALYSVPAHAQASGTTVFDSIPSPLPGNVPSQGYQCCGTSEIGDLVQLEADTPRRAGHATVLMSSWALRSSYPSMPSAGYAHPITLAIYADAASAASHTPMVSVTQTFTIPWRPEADPTCEGGTAWRYSPTQCFNGYAFNITFDLRALNLDLPEQFIFGVAFNTNTWGYSPLGVGGPYESLNVGVANVNGAGVPPSVGVDLDPDVVYWNTVHAGWYSDGGVGGFGILRPDTGWLNYQPAVRFTTFSVPSLTRDCKNGAWENLVRANFSPFKNQGECVAYVNTGK